MLLVLVLVLLLPGANLLLVACLSLEREEGSRVVFFSLMLEMSARVMTGPRLDSGLGC